MTYLGNKSIKNLTAEDIGKFIFYVPFEGCSTSLIEKGRIKSFNNDKETAFVVYKCVEDWDNYLDYTASCTNYNNLFLKKQ